MGNLKQNPSLVKWRELPPLTLELSSPYLVDPAIIIPWAFIIINDYYYSYVLTFHQPLPRLLGWDSGCKTWTNNSRRWLLFRHQQFMILNFRERDLWLVLLIKNGLLSCPSVYRIQRNPVVCRKLYPLVYF